MQGPHWTPQPLKLAQGMCLDDNFRPAYVALLPVHPMHGRIPLVRLDRETTTKSAAAEPIQAATGSA